MIVDQHQPVVEKYYGPGKMKSVVERLLQECDRVVKGLLERWEEERSIKRKVRFSNGTRLSNFPQISSISLQIFLTILQFQCFHKSIDDLRLR